MGEGSEHSAERRRFLGDSLRSLGVAVLLGAGVGLHSRSASSLPAPALRPPGALQETDFGGACVRCGLCVRDCPFGTLRLARVGEEVPLGTPYFVAREIPCEMCEDIPCVKACPTGALDPRMTAIDEARMGLAVLSDQENCVAFSGLRCEVCFNICPVRGRAITLEYRHNERSGKHALFIPEVHADACTGCGKCEKACILEEAAIKVLPLTLARGALGAHYRLGWEEKSKAGGSLVAPDRPHEYNLPPGMDYEHGGEGLRKVPEATPFGDDPLTTLNRGLEGMR